MVEESANNFIVKWYCDDCKGKVKCAFFATNGFCTHGQECPYLHLEGSSSYSSTPDIPDIPDWPHSLSDPALPAAQHPSNEERAAQRNNTAVDSKVNN
jgi:Zinc finger C-x8-C-x5-C-x3-H type (and similar)